MFKEGNSHLHGIEEDEDEKYVLVKRVNEHILLLKWFWESFGLYMLLTKGFEASAHF